MRDTSIPAPKFCPYCGGDALKFVDTVPRCSDLEQPAVGAQVGRLVRVQHPGSWRGPIPVGATIFHDNFICRWPNCANPEGADPSTVFDITSDGQTVTCKAPGFGGNPYRNGSILVKVAHWLQASGEMAPAEAEYRSWFPLIPNVGAKQAPTAGKK